jgi:hypothetical protein
VMKHYAHAMDDPTVTDVLFDTPVTQGQQIYPVTSYKQKGKSI